MIRIRIFSFSVILFTSLISLSAFASSAPSSITVGTLYATSGNFSSISMPVYKGLKLWVKHVNADGGAYIKPYDKKIPIKLVAYNDQSQTSTATNLYDQLITKDKVDILVSDSGSVLTSVAVPLAQEHKKLLFDQTGTGEQFFSKDNPYIVQLDDPISSLWPKRLAEFLKKEAVKHGVHRVAILYSTNDFTGTQAQALHGYLKGQGNKLKVVYYHGVPTSTNNYMVLIHRIKAAHPDAVLELGYPNNDIAFLSALQSSGIKFPLLFTIYPGLETQLIEKNVGDKVMKNVLTYVPATALHYKVNYGMPMPKFKKAYREMYGNNVDVGFNAVAGYTTGLVIQKALATTKDMSAMSLRKAVFAASGKMETLDGKFRLNSEGAQIGELTPIGQIQPKGKSGVKLVPIYPSQLAAGQMNWPSH